ncbi:MAG: 6-bladed beta-propeller [Phycisphaerae bacterium]
MIKKTITGFGSWLSLLSLPFFCGCSAFQSPAIREKFSCYPPKPAPVRVIALGSVTGQFSTASEPSAFRRFVTGENESDTRSGLVRPLAVVARGGELLVCDVGLGAVVRMDPSNGTMKPLINSGIPNPVKPVALAVGQEGNVFIADVLSGQVIEISADGTMKNTFRLPEQQGKFKPIAVAVSTRQMYVINGASQSVEIFDLTTSRYKGRLGSFFLPVAICVDHEGKIYVIDMLKCQVQVYHDNGRLIREIGSPGNLPGQFARPRGLTVGSEGIIYITDAATQVVQMFDPAGNLLMTFGGAGSVVGELTLPAGICTDKSLMNLFAPKLPTSFIPDYLIFVANQFGPGRIGVYAFGKFRDN